MAYDESHEVLAQRLRSRVGDTGAVSKEIRESAFALGAGHEAPAAGPVSELAKLIGAGSFRVTDAMVKDVRETLGSDLTAFEVVMSASVGAGLMRWDVASQVIGEAADETP